MGHCISARVRRASLYANLVHARRASRRALIAAACGIVVSGASVAKGDNYTWIGGVSDQWADLGNWLENGSAAQRLPQKYPAGSDSVVIDGPYAVGITGSQQAYSIVANATLVLDGTLDTYYHGEFIGDTKAGSMTQVSGQNSGDVYVGVQSGSTGSYQLLGGTLGGTVVLGRYAGAAGSFTLGSSGSVQTGWTYVGDEGTGTFVQNGGAHVTSGLFIANGQGGGGTYVLTDGTLASAWTEVGSPYYGSPNAASFVQTGGTHVVGSTAGPGLPTGLSIGSVYGATASYRLDNGALNVSTFESLESENSSFVQNGGVNTIAQGLSIGGTYTLNSGSLSNAGATVSKSEQISGGTFNQFGGTNETGVFVLGGDIGAEDGGCYTLADGTLSVTAVSLQLGLYDETYGAETIVSGTFAQTGGANRVSGELLVVGAQGYPGSGYQLDGGELSVAGDEEVQYFGKFVQTAGTHTVGLSLYVNGGSLAVRGGGLEAGSMIAFNSGSITLSGGAAAAGEIDLLAGGSLTVTGGSLTSARGVDVDAAGVLRGNGTLGCDVFNHAGTVAPGTDTATGKLTVTGAYSQLKDGSLAVRINGTSASGKFDTLAVGADAHLAGHVVVDLSSGFTPVPLDTYKVLTASSVSGAFDNGKAGRIVTASTGKDFFKATVSSDGVSLKYLTPKDVLQGAVHPVFNGAKISAEFIPNEGLTLAEAATVCGVDHFNWVQFIVAIPSAWTYKDETGAIVPLPIVDPPVAPHRYTIYNSNLNGPATSDLNELFAGDAYLPYWNESIVYSTFVMKAADDLHFEDTPSRGAGWFLPGETMDFVTLLAGMDAKGNVIQTWHTWGTNISWSSNAVNATGGIYDSTIDDGTLPAIVSGGIVDVQVDVPEPAALWWVGAVGATAAILGRGRRAKSPAQST